MKFQSHQNSSMVESQTIGLSYSPENLQSYELFPVDSSWISAQEPLKSVSIGAYIESMKSQQNPSNTSSEGKNTVDE